MNSGSLNGNICLPVCVIHKQLQLDSRSSTTNIIQLPIQILNRGEGYWYYSISESIYNSSPTNVLKKLKIMDDIFKRHVGDICYWTKAICNLSIPILHSVDYEM